MGRKSLQGGEGRVFPSQPVSVSWDTPGSTLPWVHPALPSQSRGLEDHWAHPALLLAVIEAVIPKGLSWAGAGTAPGGSSAGQCRRIPGEGFPPQHPTSQVPPAMGMLRHLQHGCASSAGTSRKCITQRWLQNYCREVLNSPA